MKLSQLLSQRSALLRQVRLANAAFAYQVLTGFAARVHRAGLSGRVVLKPIDPAADRYVTSLTALAASQSVIEEHFSDEDLNLLADVIGFATGHPGHELTFFIDDLGGDFINPLRRELERQGVELPPVSRVANESNPS